MLSLLKILSVLFIIIPVRESVAQNINYKVIIRAEYPKIATVTMNLPKRTKGHELYSRAGNNQTETQVRDVKCAGEIIEQDDDGRWFIPGQCEEINWSVDFFHEDQEGIAAYEQKSILKKNSDWWIFSSPSALLRLRREPPSLKISFDVPGQKYFKTSLSSSMSPPSYFALGNVPSETIRRGGIKLTSISDDPSYTSQIINIDDHLSALEYLSSIMGLNDTGEVRHITMIMIGIIRERQSLGGAAGSNAMLVNYIFENEQSMDREKYYPVLIALHEQIHQLYRGSQLEWVEESLAHYYGSKALQRVYPDNKTINEIVEGLYTSTAEDIPGLVEIQRRIDENRDFRLYDNFYNQGSAFWYNLDKLIHRFSDKHETLDDYLAIIMRSEFKRNEGIPNKVLRYLDFIPTDILHELEEQYLFSGLN
ncbi:MAG: hypothetical protein HOH19_04040 [Kordiimonadaceae bacterium]|nr:hypothetical protein [Kordiimonadaceae bacterium]MBT6031723.1 hypothetical protein [Kordiimonadaceae bacterium]